MINNSIYAKKIRAAGGATLIFCVNMNELPDLLS